MTSNGIGNCGSNNGYLLVLVIFILLAIILGSCFI